MAGSTLRLGDDNRQLRSLSLFLRHAQYNPTRRTNDIALLFWQQPLTFGVTARAVPLPRENATVPYGEMCNVSGWGISREDITFSLSATLHVTLMELFTNEVCNRAYDGRVTPGMVCAGLEQGGRGACLGDTGGPLTVKGVLYGIVSWSRGCGRPGFPGVYTSIPFYINWIRQNIV